MKKESNFVSAVVYLSDDNNNPEQFLKKLLNALDYYFEHFELILVNDCCKNQATITEYMSSYAGQNIISVIHMSVKQGVEICLAAGLDVSIGDFVFEFDSADIEIDKDLVWKVYQKALEGNDIVSVETKDNNFSRKLFYRLFNKYSKTDYDINASMFRLVSRRAINRVLNLNISSAFRQAMYASCGLKNASVEINGKARQKKARDFDLAVNSFLLYTILPEKICAFSTRCMIGCIILGIICLITKLMCDLAWINIVLIADVLLAVTNMSVCLIIMLYYLRLIIKGKEDSYLIENIEKIQKG